MTQAALLNATWDVVSSENIAVENDENDESITVEESFKKKCKNTHRKDAKKRVGGGEAV